MWIIKMIGSILISCVVYPIAIIAWLFRWLCSVIAMLDIKWLKFLGVDINEEDDEELIYFAKHPFKYAIESTKEMMSYMYY